MKKYFVTGFSGFVAKHFLEFLSNLGSKSLVLGVDLDSPQLDGFNSKNVKWSFQELDLLDRERLDLVVSRFEPDCILHLASFSSVSFSWQNPVQSFVNNTNIFLNLLEAVRKLKKKVRVLSVGSSEEYGAVPEASLPISESLSLSPSSPYAVARVAQELLSRVYCNGFGLDIIFTRSFNHIGPGQKEIFVVPSFAKQMVDVKKLGRRSCELIVGNIEVIRDFVDVRDVVSAYYSLFEAGQSCEAYNICSGKGTRLKAVVDAFSRILGLEVTLIRDEKLFRPNDIGVVIGSFEKIQRETGWTPKIVLEKSLDDIAHYWMSVC